MLGDKHMDLPNVISVLNKNRAVGEDQGTRGGRGGQEGEEEEGEEKEEGEEVREEKVPAREDQCGRAARLVPGDRSLPAPCTYSPHAGASSHLSSSN